MCVYTYMCIHVCVHICAYTYMCAYMCIYVCTCMCLCILHMCVYTYVYTYMCVYTYICVCVYIYIVCMCVFWAVCSSLTRFTPGCSRWVTPPCDPSAPKCPSSWRGRPGGCGLLVPDKTLKNGALKTLWKGGSGRAQGGQARAVGPTEVPQGPF